MYVLIISVITGALTCIAAWITYFIKNCNGSQTKNQFQFFSYFFSSKIHSNQKETIVK